MKKKLLGVAVVLVVLIVVALVAVWLYIDRLAATALTNGVEYAGDVPCEVKSVSVSLLSGSVGVKGLVIKNPKDFPEADMFALERADVKVKTSSLWNQPVHVETLEIVKPLVRLEGGLGGSNVQVFLANVNRKVGGAADEPEEQDEAEPTRIIVDKLLLKDATVRIGSGISPTKLGDVVLQTVELSDIRGRDGQGVTAGELAGKIIYELVRKGLVKVDLDLGKVLSKDVTEGFDKLAKEAEKVTQEAQKVFKDVTKPLDSLLKPREGSQPKE